MTEESGTPRSVAASGTRGVAVGGDVRDSVIFTGDLVLRGIHQLWSDYAARIQNFLAEYFGTAAHPVPFGGRHGTLRFFDQWLADSSGPPYLFLGAAAGRGKSALLAHWSRRLLRSENAVPPEISFFPVSARFRTNLASVVFPTLASRLARIHGEVLGGTAQDSPEVWRGILAEYLRRPLPDGRSVVLILDGVDEAADWEIERDLFPRLPPSGLRVVVSARLTATAPTPEAWLERLGWDRSQAATLTLDPLDLGGVIEAMRGEALGLDPQGRETVAAELYRLSNGDPLLVRLYVDALNRCPEGASAVDLDLRTLEPGLDSYFRRWWEDQRRIWGDKVPLREISTRAVLNLLSCALGPLRAEDLLEVAAPEAGLDSWALREALRTIERLVVEDGAHGFVFAHPRLAAYFFEGLAPAERRSWERRFTIWGERIVSRLAAGEILAEDVPPYLAQFLGAHQERTGAGVDGLLPLIDEAWWQARLALDGTHAGFLSDVDRIWNAAEAENWRALRRGVPPRHLATEILCALCHATVRNLSDNLNVRLLGPLIEAGRWTPTQALVRSRYIPEPERRASAMLALVPHLQGEPREDAIEEALNAARSMNADDDRVLPIFAGLIPHLHGAARTRILQQVSGWLLNDNGFFCAIRVIPELVPYFADAAMHEAIFEVTFQHLHSIRPHLERGGAAVPPCSSMRSSGCCLTLGSEIIGRRWYWRKGWSSRQRSREKPGSGSTPRCFAIYRLAPNGGRWSLLHGRRPAAPKTWRPLPRSSRCSATRHYDERCSPMRWTPPEATWIPFTGLSPV
jgi:hypothetical protein